MIVYLQNIFLLNTLLARMLLTPRWVSRQKDEKMWNRLESTCWLFVAYYHEFLNRKSYDGSVILVERELRWIRCNCWKRTLKISYLTIINHWKELREFVLFIKLFVVTKMKILNKTLERITRHWIRPAYTKALGVPSKYILCSGSIRYPVRSSMLKNKRIFSLVIS